MGSVIILKIAIAKYGVDKFEKEVLYIFNNEEDMNLMEGEIANEEFVARLDTYNLKLGGEGGFDYINEKATTEQKSRAGKKGGTQFGKNLKENEELRAKDFKQKSERWKKLHKEGRIKYDTFTGKKHNEESKKKIGKANSFHQKGKKNSQYGTCWVYSESSGESTKIKKEDLPFYLARGWIKGRKIKR